MSNLNNKMPQNSMHNGETCELEMCQNSINLMDGSLTSSMGEKEQISNESQREGEMEQTSVSWDMHEDQREVEQETRSMPAQQESEPRQMTEDICDKCTEPAEEHM